jgi:predicted RNase H-like nuclease (RuvC/YqgF family)
LADTGRSGRLLVPKATTELSKKAQRKIRSFERNIAEHRAKLEAFKKSSDAFDNKGFLKNAPSQAIRDQIIEGRIQHLEGEIRNWQNQIDRLLQGGS